MGHPLVAEFCRATSFNPGFLRKCQRIFRAEVQTALDELAQMREDYRLAMDRNRELQTALSVAQAPKKRGRPKKAAA